MREYRNKISGVVVLVESEIRGEDWEEISDSLSESDEKESEKPEEKPKRKTASKKKK